MKTTVLSAVQPTEGLHLGNYLGAIRNWISYQQDHDCLFFVVDLHAITVRQDPLKLRDNIERAVATYLACGLDPKNSTLFAQSMVPEILELSWVLTCHSSMGELSRMTQFKDKSSKQGENIPTGLFVYPVLMAADILAFRTSMVPVGDDQKQHVELTRDLAERMNNAYGKDLFVVPKPMLATTAKRVFNLLEPESKMSKSDPTGLGVIFLSDDDKTIEKKFKRAVTDSGLSINPEALSPGLKNLMEIQAAIKNEPLEAVAALYAGKQYGVLKVETAQVVIEHLRPIREKTDLWLKDRSALHQILREGAEKARERASSQVKEVYKRIGFVGRC
jgi:tryptophanyl-tRNA synthetase